MEDGNILLHRPLDFSSAVHPLTSSCISSGSTSFLDQASSHFGFGGGNGADSDSLNCFLDLVLGLTVPASLLRKTLEKNGMMGEIASKISFGYYSHVIDATSVEFTVPYPANASYGCERIVKMWSVRVEPVLIAADLVIWGKVKSPRDSLCREYKGRRVPANTAQITGDHLWGSER